MFNDALQATLYPLQMSRSASFSCLNRFQLGAYVFTRKMLSRFGHLNQSVGNRAHFYLTQMQHNEWGTQPFSEIDCLKRLFNSALPFFV
jgi:hypothetical protein